MAEFPTKIIKCLHRLCEFQLNSSLVFYVNSPFVGEGETHDGIKWKLWLMGENLSVTTGENVVIHGISFGAAAGAGSCQQHVEIARRYPVLFL